MFTPSKAFSSFSADDIKKVKFFYRDTLGIETSENDMGILTLHPSGGGEVMIYPKGEEHQAATFTVLNFQVDDIKATVEELTKAGILFEEYDGVIKTDGKGISHGDKTKGHPDVAWFKDPSGNILSIIQQANNDQ